MNADEEPNPNSATSGGEEPDPKRKKTDEPEPEPEPDQDPEKILWMRLPDWADEVPENCVFYMMEEELAVRHKIQLTPYDPNNKEKGRKIVLITKSDLEEEKHCDACGKENGHFSFQCPNDPDRELMEQKVINGVKMDMYCDICNKEDDHSSWKCPDLKLIPYDPPNGGDMICEVCGDVGEHWTDVCPELYVPPEAEPGLRECHICQKYDDSEHWTEDCPVLANGDHKFCFSCLELGDHETLDCDKFVRTVVFCSCCGASGDHTTEDCPREANDGRKYCGICDWLGDHSTNCCPLNGDGNLK